MLGLSFSHLERTTDVTVADLQPGVANRLHEAFAWTTWKRPMLS